MGSPVTDLYVGFSIVAVAFWVGRKAAGLFDEPPTHGRVVLVDAGDRRYRGGVTKDGDVSFRGPDGGAWTGSAWNGRWTLTDPDGTRWWGVARGGAVLIQDEEGTELRGTLDSTEE